MAVIGGAGKPGGPSYTMFDGVYSKELEVLFRIAQEMTKLLDLNELLDHVVSLVSNIMGYTNCVILLCDEEREHLTLAAGLGISQPVVGLKIPKGIGIAWSVMAAGIPQNVGDVAKDPRYYEVVGGIGSEIYAPLAVRGKRLGILLVQKAETHGFEANDVKLTQAVAGHIAAALEVAQLHERVKRAALTDSLTGLHNRRMILESIDSAIERSTCTRPIVPVSVAILDVDCLKYINDKYGHLVGDAVLARIGKHLKNGFRACDKVGRYGGDEFVVLLPGATREASEKRIKGMLGPWRSDRIVARSGESIQIPGASFGVACYPFDGEEARTVLSVADDRLLEVKRRRIGQMIGVSRKPDWTGQ